MPVWTKSSPVWGSRLNTPHTALHSLPVILYQSLPLMSPGLVLTLSGDGGVQLLSHVQLFATPWTAVSQTSLSFTLCPSLLKFMSIESVMPSNHPILAPFSCPQSLPAPVSFPTSWLFTSGGQNIGTSASASVLLMNIQGWFPLGLTGLISLLSKGLSRVFSNTTV